MSYFSGVFMQVVRRIVGLSLVLVGTLGVLMVAGCSSGSTGSGTNITATPTFSPGAGSYNAAQTVTIADTTSGAVLYCTTDGTTPTTSSPQCSQPTTVFKTEFLQAIAVAPGRTPSAVASAGYTINLNAAATPTFSPSGGSYNTAQIVTINDTTTGANLYYTLDGSVPTTASTLYTGPVTLSKSATLSAIAVASGFANSGVASANYVIGTGVATPVITPTGGTFATAQSVTITDATGGATIYYTIDGSMPSSSSTLYSGPITVASSETITAIAIASGTPSSPATATFVINIASAPAAAPPTFNPAAGTYSAVQQVILNDATSGAVMYYTLDGSVPTTSSTAYSGPINVTTSETIKAIATAPGFSTSAVASAAYTINLAVPPPTFDPPAGTYTSAQSVSLSDTASGAIIYYTVDGSTPTTSSTVYSGPISVATSETINAIAVAGGQTSPVATAIYTINILPNISGKVMSGSKPVNGASVQMYVASSDDYAADATPVLTTPVTTGADGSFTLMYNCPDASSGDLAYLIASGGSTGSGGSNGALVFMTALGSCNATPPQTVVVNEVTTVASAYALSPFMTGATNVGSSSANYSTSVGQANGLANAFATVSNIVDLTSGVARDHTPAYQQNLAGDPNILNNSTVPQARINTLANALNLCAVDGNGCSTLFTAATVGTGTAPANTLQAILNIAQNPGNNAAGVYNVIGSNPGAFTPSLQAAPNDWTLALTFTGGGLGFAPNFQIPSVNTGSLASGKFTDGKFVNTSMAIDPLGRIWVTGFVNSRTLLGGLPTLTPDLASGMVAVFDHLGAPQTPASTVSSGSTPAVTYGGFMQPNNGQTNAGTVAPFQIAFDPPGNAWVFGGSPLVLGTAGAPTGAMTQISPSLTFVQPDVVVGFISGYPPAIDSDGHIWMETQDSTGTNVLAEFDGQTGAMILSNNNQTGNPQWAFGYFGAYALTFDSNAEYLWDSERMFSLYQINLTDGSVVQSYYPGFDQAPTSLVAASSNPDGSAGNVYGCADAGGQTLDAFNGPSMSIVQTYPVPTGRGCGSKMVMDGLGHLFAVTGGTSGTIDEFSVNGNALTMVSPMAGYTGTSSGESPTINPDPAPPVLFSVPQDGVSGAAIDGSGNLWVLNVDTGVAGSPGNALVEFIGIAAPVVTPTSLALQFGQVGVRP
jgi:hypothetical protein